MVRGARIAHYFHEKKSKKVPILLDTYTALCVYLVMKNEIKKKGNEMNYEDYMELIAEEIGESLEVEAMEEALSDMEEEYGSETVNDYMNYGV